MLGAKQEEPVPKRLRLVVYKEDEVNYRYRVHGANPTIRGRFRISAAKAGVSELAVIKDSLQARSHRLNPFIASLKVVS
jgi:hypothetical protein